MMVIPEELVRALRSAEHIVVLTGAGISAESGVPTFREAQTGLWAQYDPQELASPAAFRRNPRLVWEWYEWRRQLVAEAKPNSGHLALVKLEQFVPQFSLITQNVDGLHARAGNQNIIELHGNIRRTKCFDNEHAIHQWTETDAVPPLCPECGSMLRPDVVWFGESLPSVALHTAVNAARSCDIFFSIGTSALVHPAASLPLEALQNRIPVVEVNPQDTPLTPYVTYNLPGPAGEVLLAVVDKVMRG